MTENDSIEEHLKELEQSLLRPEVRKSATAVGVLLADDFKEFVSTGQIYNKAQIIELLQKAPMADSALTDFKALMLAPDVALATFFYSRGATHDRPAAKSIRVYLKRIDGRWQMVFTKELLSEK
jgi:hypothetical protein